LSCCNYAHADPKAKPGYIQYLSILRKAQCSCCS